MNAIFSDKIPKIVPIKSTMIKIGEDEILFNRIQAGDEKAFESLFKSYYQKLCQYAYSYVVEIEEAEEIVQTVFLKIWENRQDINLEISFNSYCYQSIKNKCLNHIRDSKNRRRILNLIPIQENAESHILEVLQTDEIRDQMYMALENLPPKCKQIFQLSRIDGLKHKEIAEKLGLQTKTIENQIGIALKLLRLHLANFLHAILFIILQNIV